MQMNKCDRFKDQTIYISSGISSLWVIDGK
uniref:Uncharacterized protein n=1 Tax=Anguilla anguilla TaxID=7936 RepID=A0A0E9P5Y1_ANGAN